MKTLQTLIPGDLVNRYFNVAGAQKPHQLLVVKITETTIECDIPGAPTQESTWIFNRETGNEIDDDFPILVSHIEPK